MSLQELDIATKIDVVKHLFFATHDVMAASSMNATQSAKYVQFHPFRNHVLISVQWVDSISWAVHQSKIAYLGYCIYVYGEILYMVVLDIT